MGTWLDPTLVETLTFQLDDIQFDQHHNMIQFTSSSPLPIISKLYTSEGEEGFEINLYILPKGKQLLDLMYSAGTVQLFKLLYGSITINSFSNQRLIQSHELENNQETLSKSIRRIGGVSRSIQSNNVTESYLLEIIFHPPLADHPSSEMFGGINYKMNVSPLDANPSVLSVLIPNQTLHEIFQSISINRLNRINNNTLTLNSMPLASLTPSPVPISSDTLQDSPLSHQLNYQIGGLNQQINDIIRRILLTRQLKSSQLLKLGVITPVKGLLLYGPPGTGKTLIAREMAKALDAREVRIVNGPDILDKYIGEAERNIRELFKNAEDEWNLKQMDSALHVIIFDEIDAIMKRRGSLIGDGSGTRDSCVNQLLSKMDGIREMNNILIIGLTNRKDLIDPALLRPGRFEMHVEIQNPDSNGREMILAILLRPLVNAKCLSKKEALQWIDKLLPYTKDWNGAELAGLVRCAVSYALERYYIMISKTIRNTDDKVVTDNDERVGMKLEWDDMSKALIEMKETSSVNSFTNGRAKLPFHSIIKKKWNLWKPFRKNQNNLLNQIEREKKLLKLLSTDL